MRRGAFVVALLLILIVAAAVSAQSRDPASDAMRGEKRLALVIGNAAYRASPLRNPVNDAREMARALQASGFEVLAHENIGQKQMRRAVLEFGDRLRQGGVGLFYFAGHGVQVNGRNYLVPTDAEINSEAEVEIEGVDVAIVLTRMETAKNRVNVVILDACRDNPFARRYRSTSRGLASINAPAGTLIAYATAPGDVGLDGEGKNSVYTTALLKAIAVPGLRVEDIFKLVRAEVQQQTRGKQVPWESTSLTGELILAPSRVTLTRGDDGAEMVLVPAGEFWMGSTPTGVGLFTDECKKAGIEERVCKDRGQRETPQHRVVLDAFYIDRYEVTNAFFARFVRAAGHRTQAEREGFGGGVREKGGGSPWFKIDGAHWRQPNGPGTSSEATHPVVQVSRHDAEAYCTWAGKRLPSEAEWEKAARGTDRRRYPWGDAWESTRANADFTVSTTKPVGSYPTGVSPYGLYDMTGNVWEWVADWFDAAYYQRSPERDPRGPASGDRKIVRGGSWSTADTFVRTTVRSAVAPDERNTEIGFRCAMDHDPSRAAKEGYGQRPPPRAPVPPPF